jgi:hypothetical protein
MLAIVIDTIDDFKMAFFTPKSGKDNVMNNAEDVKKTIMLDELYHWAETGYIEPQKEKQEPTVKITGTPAKEYFPVPLIQKTENVDEIRLTRAVIIEMSMGNKGLLCGKNQDNNLLIDAFVEDGDNPNKIFAQTGIFKKISNFENNEEWERCKQILIEDMFWENNQLLAIYCLKDKNLYLFTGKQNANRLEEQNLPTIATVIPLQDMISWTREKRN